MLKKVNDVTKMNFQNKAKIIEKKNKKQKKTINLPG